MPTNANAYTYLNWSCSEDGYFSADGTVLITADKITSNRTLTLTGTAPSETTAKSTVSGGSSQTIQMEILAPEIYSATMSDRVIKTGRDVRIMVSTNANTPQVVLRSAKDTSGQNYQYFSMPEASDTIANGQCRVAIFSIPDEITETAGDYPLFLFAADSHGNYTTYATGNDVYGTTNYAYKNIGPLYVRDTVSTGTSLTIVGDKTVNRSGQSAVFSVNSGTGSSSPQNPTGSYSFSMTNSSQRKYVGDYTHYYVYGCGNLGKKYGTS